MERQIRLSSVSGTESFILPINPNPEYLETNNNPKETLLNIGEINLIGNRGLISCNLSSFFPSSLSPFFKRADREPVEYISLLRKWKESGEPIRLIDTGEDINLAMTIEKLNHHRNEGDSDIYYSLELVEYVFLNVPKVKNSSPEQKNGLKKRPKSKAKKSSYTVKKGDSMWAISKKIYGNGSKYKIIYEANRKKIDSKNQKYHQPKYTIYPGQVLVIP